MSLTGYNRSYEEIMKLPPSPRRNKQLSELMDQMKWEYGIPLIRDVEWERRNPKVIALYRKASMSRDL
jgi:alkylated DNA nucleotide flippase Atl1